MQRQCGVQGGGHVLMRPCATSKTLLKKINRIVTITNCNISILVFALWNLLIFEPNAQILNVTLTDSQTDSTHGSQEDK
jgi:hypothetical protein